MTHQRLNGARCVAWREMIICEKMKGVVNWIEMMSSGEAGLDGDWRSESPLGKDFLSAKRGCQVDKIVKKCRIYYGNSWERMTEWRIKKGCDDVERIVEVLGVRQRRVKES